MTGTCSALFLEQPMASQATQETAMIFAEIGTSPGPRAPFGVDTDTRLPYRFSSGVRD